MFYNFLLLVDSLLDGYDQNEYWEKKQRHDKKCEKELELRLTDLKYSLTEDSSILYF